MHRNARTTRKVCERADGRTATGRESSRAQRFRFACAPVLVGLSGGREKSSRLEAGELIKLAALFASLWLFGSLSLSRSPHSSRLSLRLHPNSDATPNPRARLASSHLAGWLARRASERHRKGGAERAARRATARGTDTWRLGGHIMLMFGPPQSGANSPVSFQCQAKLPPLPVARPQHLKRSSGLTLP